MINAWTYTTETDPGDIDVIGFDVEAEDGHLGKVDQASNEAGNAHVVVDTGLWIFGKKRVIPARFVRQVNPDTEKVFVSLAKSQIEDAPDFDESKQFETDYRDAVVAHFSSVRR